MIRVFIADDHPLIREGFKKLIDKEVDITVVGEASDSDRIVQFFRDHDCDVLVLDINMPGKGGLEVLQDIKRWHPNLKVLILSIYPEEQFAVRALRAGAVGYITKESAPEELVKAIRKVHQGGRYISETVAEHLAREVNSSRKREPHEALSPREFQVFHMLGQGKTVQEIAHELSLSLSTVNTYRRRILEKTGLKSNAEIIHYAIKNKLVE
ncbi:MAG: DNA-binding response regulator [Calditrichaeota bacterium]|nr:MAG: DNA-binding response regulator [Calditrichota bacterium]